LLPFNAGSILTRSENFEPFCLKTIDDARHQGGFRPDDGQTDPVFLCELHEPIHIFCMNRHTFGKPLHPVVARGTKNPFHLVALRQFPDQGVFAPAASYNQHVHFETLPLNG
jgi:hypothetical protein